MVSSALLTSNNQEWRTPQEFFSRIDSTYHFTLDACASRENAMCQKFFTAEDDGLIQSWSGHSVWINPPYEPARKTCKPGCKSTKCAEHGFHYRKDIPGQIAWVKKAYNEVRENGCNVAVCLLPARTDTKLFHHYVMRASLVCFLSGRLTFSGAAHGAVFPSMLVSFESWQRNDMRPFPRFTTMSAR